LPQVCLLLLAQAPQAQAQAQAQAHVIIEVGVGVDLVDQLRERHLDLVLGLPPDCARRAPPP